MKHLKTFENESAFEAAKDNLAEPWVALVSDNVVYSSDFAIPNDTTWYYSDGTSWSKLVEGELDDAIAQSSDGTHAYGEITNVEIGKSVTSIGLSAFKGCRSLTSVTIGNSVTSIDGQAFYNCTSLTSVTYNGTIEQWNAITKGIYWKDGVPTTCIVHCTDGDIAIADA